jgi:uncharacterized protein (TIGR02301 family)
MIFLHKQAELQTRRRHDETHRAASLAEYCSAFGYISPIFCFAFEIFLAAFTCVAILVSPAEAKHHPHATAAHSKTPHHKSASGKSAPAEARPDASAHPKAPASEPPPPPYEAQILRLTEILGALTYLDDLCGASEPIDWRAKMQQLLEAETKSTFRKEQLAGTFNRSLRDYERSYPACTANAQTIISRFLGEGGKLAHDVVNRYSAL